MGWRVRRVVAKPDQRRGRAGAKTRSCRERLEGVRAARSSSWRSGASSEASSRNAKRVSATASAAQAASDTSRKVGEEAKGWLTVLFLVVAGFAALPVIGRLDVGRGFALAALVLILGGLAFAQAACGPRSTASGPRSADARRHAQPRGLPRAGRNWQSPDP